MEYRQRLKNYKRIIIKVGTTSLTYENGKFNLRKMERFAKVLTDLRNRDIDVVLGRHSRRR